MLWFLSKWTSSLFSNNLFPRRHNYTLSYDRETKSSSTLIPQHTDIYQAHLRPEMALLLSYASPHSTAIEKLTLIESTDVYKSLFTASLSVTRHTTPTWLPLTRVPNSFSHLRLEDLKRGVEIESPRAKKKRILQIIAQGIAIPVVDEALNRDIDANNDRDGKIFTLTGLTWVINPIWCRHCIEWSNINHHSDDVFFALEAFRRLFDNSEPKPTDSYIENIYLPQIHDSQTGRDGYLKAPNSSIESNWYYKTSVWVAEYYNSRLERIIKEAALENSKPKSENLIPREAPTKINFLTRLDLILSTKDAEILIMKEAIQLDRYFGKDEGFHMLSKIYNSMTRQLVSNIGEKVAIQDENSWPVVSLLLRDSGRIISNSRQIIDNMRDLCDGFGHKLDVVRFGQSKVDITYQRKVFQNSKVIVSLHGAELTNMIFSPDSTVIVEIFPCAYMPRMYQHMAKALGLQSFTVENKNTNYLDRGGKRINCLKDFKQMDFNKKRTFLNDPREINFEEELRPVMVEVFRRGRPHDVNE